MFKHSIAIIILSITVILTMANAQHLLQMILSAHLWVANTLTEVFSGGSTGNLVRQLLALLAIPILAGFIPVFLYWLARRRWFPYFMQIVWITWLVQTAALIIEYKVIA